jgi:hypothetical protein
LPAICLTTDAVRSYRTFSPLPFDSAGLAADLAQGGIFSVPLVLQVALTGRYPAHCPLEFGLSSRHAPCGAQQTIILPAATTQCDSKGLGAQGLRGGKDSRLKAQGPTLRMRSVRKVSPPLLLSSLLLIVAVRRSRHYRLVTMLAAVLLVLTLSYSTQRYGYNLWRRANKLNSVMSP